MNNMLIYDQYMIIIWLKHNNINDIYENKKDVRKICHVNNFTTTNFYFKFDLSKLVNENVIF